MLGVDPESGASLVRLWIAAGSAALLVALCAVAFLQQARLAAKPALRAGLVAGGALLGAATTWALLDRAMLVDSAAERRALELRAQELSERVLVPGSPLACLDALVGESVEAACEKSLFASPATVAAASAYVAAQLSLLANMTTFGHGQGAEPQVMTAPLRRALETDRFGFVAYVLAIRDGCTAQNCKTLALFHDGSRVRTNLTTAALERYLEHYAAGWTAGPDVPIAEAAPAPSPLAAAGQPPRKLINIDFPTAASIPAVSIMNPEPKGPVLPGVAAAAAANPNAPPPSGQRHAHKPPPNPNAASAAPSSQPPVEPIWPEPMPASPAAAAPQTAAAPPSAASAPANTGPVQLTPSAVNAGAAPPPRSQ